MGGLTKLIHSMIILLEDQEGNRHPVEAVVIAAHSSLVRNILKYEGVTELVMVPCGIDGEMEAIRTTKVINLPIQSTALAEIISFVENGNLDFKLELISDILVGSEYLGMRALSRIIISRMSHELNFINVPSVLSFSREFMIPELEDLCKRLINTWHLAFQTT